MLKSCRIRKLVLYLPLLEGDKKATLNSSAWRKENHGSFLCFAYILYTFARLAMKSK